MIHVCIKHSPVIVSLLFHPLSMVFKIIFNILTFFLTFSQPLSIFILTDDLKLRIQQKELSFLRFLSYGMIWPQGRLNMEGDFDPRGGLTSGWSPV